MPLDHGSCQRCAHHRTGASIAGVTFARILPAVQAAVEQIHVSSIDEEAQLAGGRRNEATQQARLGLDTYSRRPTERGYSYCGLDEFTGTFYITAIKNDAESCGDFAGLAGPATRSCDTCRHLRTPAQLALDELERCALTLADGGKLVERVRGVLQSRAPTEYQGCVKGMGVLAARPGFLPWCAARSQDQHFVVGPVVNVGDECGLWEPGFGGETGETAEIERLVAVWEQERVRDADDRLWQQLPDADFDFNSPLSFLRSGKQLWAAALHWSVRWAAGELVCHCLRVLGADAAFVASIRTSIAGTNAPIGRSDREMERLVVETARREVESARFIVPGLAVLRDHPIQQQLAATPARQQTFRPAAGAEVGVGDRIKFQNLYEQAAEAGDATAAVYAYTRLIGWTEHEATDFYMRARTGGDPTSTAYWLAAHIRNHGHAPEAETGQRHWLRVAAGGSRVNPRVAAQAAETLFWLDPTDAAREKEYRRGAEQGEPRSAIRLGLVLLERNDFDAGLAWLQRGLDAAPAGSPTASHAQAMLQIGRLKKAAAAPLSPPTRTPKGQILGQPDEMKRWFEYLDAKRERGE